MNTLAWPLAPLPAGGTCIDHTAHDWAMRNIRDAEVAPSKARQVGDLVASYHASAGSPRYLAIRDAYWGPFFHLAPPFAPRGPDATVAVRNAARFLLEGRDYLQQIWDGLPALRQRPVYFLFSDDNAFGPVKCDATAGRPMCIDGYTCSMPDPAPYRAFCLAEGGGMHWATRDRFVSAWDPEAVVGVWTGLDGGHFLQETNPARVAAAVAAVHEHTLATPRTDAARRGHRPTFARRATGAVAGQSRVGPHRRELRLRGGARIGTPARLFTHHWNNALRGAGDADRDGRFSLNEAFDYARVIPKPRRDLRGKRRRCGPAWRE
jgi:hypothetical protein